MGLLYQNDATMQVKIRLLRFENYNEELELQLFICAPDSTATLRPAPMVAVAEIWLNLRLYHVSPSLPLVATEMANPDNASVIFFNFAGLTLPLNDLPVYEICNATGAIIGTMPRIVIAPTAESRKTNRRLAGLGFVFIGDTTYNISALRYVKSITNAQAEQRVTLEGRWTGDRQADTVDDDTFGFLLLCYGGRVYGNDMPDTLDFPQSLISQPMQKHAIQVINNDNKYTLQWTVTYRLKLDRWNSIHQDVFIELQDVSSLAK